jgi:hypothetical protein
MSLHVVRSMSRRFDGFLRCVPGLIRARMSDSGERAAFLTNLRFRYQGAVDAARI